MVKFTLRVAERGQVYLPKEIRAEFNAKDLEMIANKYSAIMFPAGTSARDLLRSLDVIRFELEHRAECEERLAKVEY